MSIYRDIILLVSTIAVAGVVATPAAAARVADLYSATVEINDRARSPLNNAFDRALGEVLVKVTGLPEAGAAEARVGALANAAQLVQQYSRLPENQLQVSFNARAVRQALDEAGLPVWSENRPLVVIWYALDPGDGNRLILSEATEAESGDENQQITAVLEQLTGTAEQRGLPVALPLVDAEDMGVVSFADLWGDFPGPVMLASQRYGADAVLVGRARNTKPDNDRVRWTLTMDNEQFAWEGTVSSGPEQAAAMMAQRFATTADSAGTLRVLVRNVDSLEKYGQLKNYFARLSIVENSAVTRVDGSELEFELVVRGDAQRLDSTLSRSLLLQPASIESDLMEIGRLPDLVYTWAQDI
ncbi:MAG: DUF2066 domain-containing protein [Gammaproteobacteria bacterium]